MSYYTEHFNPAVDKMMACPCGRPECDHLCDYKPIFLDKMEILRILVGFPFYVTSGSRCVLHNQDVSTDGSYGQHVVIPDVKQCTALDQSCNDRRKRWELNRAWILDDRIRDYFQGTYFTPLFIHWAEGPAGYGLGIGK